MASASSRAAAAAINHVLAPAEWAREALRGHAGRVARFVLLPVEVVLAVTPDGQVAPAPDGAGADLGITLSPGDALRVLSGEATASALARIEGDAAFGATIRHLFHNLRWDFEEDLSKIMGDIAAHRAAGALRALAGLPGEVAGRLGSAATEYATEEARLVPPRAEVEAWMAEVDHLRDDVARLEARLARLAPQRED